MPELPDVEEFRRRLERHGRGQRLRNVEVLDTGVVRNTRPASPGAAKGVATPGHQRHRSRPEAVLTTQRSGAGTRR